MIPLSKKLAYYFERATGRNTVYSDVASKTTSYSTSPGTTSRWIKATPVSGQKDRYTLTSYSYYAASFLACPDYPYAGNGFSASNLSGTFSHAQLAGAFADEEKIQNKMGSEITHPFAAKELQPPKPA